MCVCAFPLRFFHFLLVHRNVLTHPLPPPGHTSQRISYTNEWDTPRVFLIRTSHPQLVKVTEPRVEIPPHASAFIRLWFVPAEPTNADVLVFINNESEQNEECLLVRVRVG